MKLYKIFKLNGIIYLKLKQLILRIWLHMLDINFNQMIEIIEMIEKRKNNAYRKVNEEMIL